MKGLYILDMTVYYVYEEVYLNLLVEIIKVLIVFAFFNL